MIILFLLAFAFPHNSGEWAHFTAPPLVTEIAFNTWALPIDYLWPNAHPASRYAANIILAEITTLVVFNLKAARRHYLTDRELQLGYTGWACQSLARCLDFGLRVPLWIRQSRRHIAKIERYNLTHNKYRGE